MYIIQHPEVKGDQNIGKFRDCFKVFSVDYEAGLCKRVVTYCAKADPIGNLRHDNDFEPYKFVDVKGGEQIPEKDDRLNNTEFLKAAIFNRIKYHSINDIYEALKKSEYRYDAI